MKKCRNCQSDISEKAKICPHCWTKQWSWFSRHPIISIILILWLIWSLSSWLSWAYTSKWTNSPIDSINSQKQEESRLAAEKKAHDQEMLNKIVLVKKSVVDKYWFAHLNIVVRNDLWVDIDWLKVKASFTDNFDKDILASISQDIYFRWISQEVLPAWKQETYEWQLSLFDNATKIKDIIIYQVHTKDWNTYWED